MPACIAILKYMGLNVLLTTLVKAIGILLDDSLPAINHAEVARGLIRLFLHGKR